MSRTGRVFVMMAVAMLHITSGQYSDRMCTRACDNAQRMQYSSICRMCVYNPPITAYMCINACRNVYFNQNRSYLPACQNGALLSSLPIECKDLYPVVSAAYSAICRACVERPPCDRKMLDYACIRMVAPDFRQICIECTL